MHGMVQCNATSIGLATFKAEVPAILDECRQILISFFCSSS